MLMKLAQMSPAARERRMDEEVLHPAIDAIAETPEQAEAAKRLHEYIDRKV